VRLVVHEAAYKRSVADWTTQPAGGLAGRAKRTSVRLLLLLLAFTLRIESVPLLLDGLPWSIQASASALRVIVVAVHAAAAVGVAVGAVVGVAVGAVVGVAVGAVVGVAVGAVVGVAVGAVVGVTVGTAVGVAVGADVGSAVGTAVGSVVGVVVGSDVGAADGAAVGVTVGSVVGVADGAVVGGAVGSVVGALTVQVYVTGEASTFPARSRARTAKVWLPAARPETWCGVVQSAYGSPSSAHS
jgi:hypothetical protein